MRVVVNQLAALGKRTGVGHYATQLLRCLREQAPRDEVDDFPKGWLRRVGRFRGCADLRPSRGANDHWLALIRPSECLSSVRRGALDAARHLGRTLVARQFHKLCGRHRYDLYHETNFIPLPSDLPTVATLHDLSVLLHPEWHPADRVAYFEKHFQLGLARCRHFLAISEFARQEIIRTLHIPPERVTRTYMGIRPGLAPLPGASVAGILHQLGLPPRYLLYLGTIEPRKNVRVLLEAYCALPAPVRSEWPLLLVGNWGWNANPVAEYLHREARHRGVIHRGYIAEANLPAIYNGARALVYPSFYEGFGLPPIEMMACGGAVLASTAEALVETVGGGAHLIDPEDVDGWRRAMLRVIRDEDWWRSLRRGVQALARPYTWERCAAETLEVYRSLSSAGRSQAA